MLLFIRTEFEINYSSMYSMKQNTTVRQSVVSTDDFITAGDVHEMS